MAAPKVLALAGSLRSGSWNKKLIRIAAEIARQQGAEVTLIDLRDYQLPIFDEDLESASGLPANGRKLKDLFIGHDALLLACPEYNSSITGVLKNTIDWVSRPAQNEKPLAAFKGKVCCLLAASPGALGGLRGLVTVRSILGNIGCLVMPNQVAVSKADQAFDEMDQLKDSKVHAQIEAAVKAMVETAAKLKQD